MTSPLLVIQGNDFGLYDIGSALYLCTSLFVNTCRFCEKH